MPRLAIPTPPAPARRAASTLPRAWRGAAGLLLATAASLAPASAALAQAPASEFAVDTVYVSPNGITALEFDHRGQMLAAEKQGRIVLFSPDGNGGFRTPPTVFASFEGVSTGSESGLLGLALDPDYANNRHIYVNYTTRSSFGADQRIVRITANADFSAMQPGSAQVVLAGLPRAVGNHKAGDIHFSPLDGNALHVALGDDGALSAVQDIDRYEGKMLRIDKRDGRGLPGNPFWNGDANAVRSRVWAIGFRNPFRFTFHPTRGDDAIYSSENGSGTDKLSRILPGSNGHWGPQGEGGGFLNPPDPGHTVLATRVPFVVGVAISASGPFGNDVLYWGRGSSSGLQIYRYQLGGAALDRASLLDGGAAFLGNGRASIDLEFGPDGHLYGSSCGGDASTNGAWPIQRIRHAGGPPPVAGFTTTPSPARGAAPLAVQFTDQSTAPSSSVVSYAWDFGDGNTSTARHPNHVYSQPGTYRARLTVRNASGQTASSQVDIEALRVVRITLGGQILDAGVQPARPLPAATELRLYRADGVTPQPLLGSASHIVAVPAGGQIAADLDLLTPGNALVISAGEAASDGVAAARQGLTLPAGSGPHAFNLQFALSGTLVRGRIVDTTQQPLRVDVGLLREGLPYPVAGGRDFLPGTQPPSGVAHRVLSDAEGWFHLPVLAADAPARFSVDAVRDTGNASHAPISEEFALARDAVRELQLVSGRWFGGVGCDDLSDQPVRANVDYQRDLQPLWTDQCVGCHNAVATNSAGLDLSAGASLAALLGRRSQAAPGVPLVTPGEPALSFLMEKINCATPQSGTRMRPSDAMARPLQALVRDWIRQLRAADGLFADGFEAP